MPAMRVRLLLFVKWCHRWFCSGVMSVRPLLLFVTQLWSAWQFARGRPDFCNLPTILQYNDETARGDSSSYRPESEPAVFSLYTHFAVIACGTSLVWGVVSIPCVGDT
ncbi:hypothetical protein R1flu_013081 [Riccia fluitans]|uniref:Secreted protein n=1 Tax=Riccia fluitans TaxID=41844 RepID=A0ABD1ZCE7_9MARC